MPSFNTIPLNILTPGAFVEFDNSRAFSGLLAIKHKVLLIAQRLAAGTVLANVPSRVTSKAEGEKFFGRGSMLAGMINAFKDNNEYTELWAVALDDLGAGVQASGTLTVTGPATKAGTLRIYIGGKRVSVAIANGDTANTIAAAINAAVNADTSLPVTSAVALAVVTLTARHKGEVGNGIDVRLNYYYGEELPAGVAIAIVAMAGGAGNPDIATAIAAIGAEQYHTVVLPYTDAANLVKIETELATRWEGMNPNDGHAFTAAFGSHATIGTLGDTRNSPHLTIMGQQKSPSLPWELATAVAAQDAAEPDPARPRQTLPLKGVLPPAEADRYSRSERNLHLGDGIATFTVDAGGVCRIERLVTTYKTNAGGVEDPSYRDVETMRTLSYFRFSVRARITQRFPRHKLAGDGNSFGAGQAVATPKTIRGELIALAQEWVTAALMEDVDQFKTDLIVEIAQSDPNRVDVIMPPNLVNQLRVFAGQVQFRS